MDQLRQRRLLGAGLFATLVLGACPSGDDDDTSSPEPGVDAGADAPPACSDADGDGYGVGPGCLGTDCDDGAAGRWDEPDCLAICDDEPHASGCACANGGDAQPEPCYSGAAGTQNVGRCLPGLRSCLEEGRWSSCVGEVTPADEDCNEVDDDCDGEVDEGVRNECGTCGDCQLDCLGVGEGCQGFDIEHEGASVVPCQADDQCVTLAEGSTTLHVLWIASAVNGTVSKLDTQDRIETGRYHSGPLGVSNGYLSGPGDGPSRTSVDASGDVCVANRAFSGQSSVTRIAVNDCPDQNGDGLVTTSTGGDDVYPWGEDECVLWNTSVGNVGGVARSLAVQDRVGLDGVVEERVWVGLFSENRYLELDRTDGSLTGGEANCAPCTPYGAAIDRDGNLWSSCLSTTLCRFDTEDPTDVELLAAPVGAYGITVDERGVVWFASGGAGDTLTAYDPATQEYTQVPGVNGAGVAVDGDGYVWTGQCNDIYGFGIGGTCRVDRETLEFQQLDAHSRGVAVDFEGQVWGVSMSGYLDVIDPGDGLGDETVERAFDDCGEGGAEGACIPEPYTYSDMSGFQLQNATDPIGSYEHIFEGCAGDVTYWGALTWEADTPDGSRITFQVRTGADLGALLAAEWIDVGSTIDAPSPIDLAAALGEGPHGTYLQVRAVLLSDDRVARPSLSGLGVQKSCDVPFG